MWPNTESSIYLIHYEIFLFVSFVSVCVFNVWPKTPLLPVQPSDTKRLDAPERVL